MPEHADKKKRLSVYLDPELMLMLADYADRRGKSRSLVAEAAIASFLTPDADERQEAAMVRRLDRIDRSIQRLERDIGIANEAFAIFMRSWLTATPFTPETLADTPIIDARLAVGLRKIGLKARQLRVAQPEKIRHVHRSILEP